MLNAFAKEYSLDAICLQAMDRKEIERIVGLFPHDKRPVVCTFSSHAEIADLFSSGNIDFAIQEEPFEQGYRATKILFDILQEKSAAISEFIEVDARIILDECL